MVSYSTGQTERERERAADFTEEIGLKHTFRLRAEIYYNKLFFLVLESGHIQEAMSSSPSPPVRGSPVQDPRLVVNHYPKAIGWSETKEEESERE